MKLTILLSILLCLCSCNDNLLPQADNNDTPEDSAPTIPVLGMKITVAYVHLKSLSYDDVYRPEIREQIKDLLSRYDVLYTFIEAGEGLRYWDFGLIKLENNIPIKNWTTGDYHETRKWNYINHKEELFQDSEAFDYNFVQHGYNNQFTKTPFGMHYYSHIDSQVRLNVIGANIDHSKYNQEMSSLENLLVNLNYWGHKRTVAFGNFTNNCTNQLNALIIQDQECPEQSVWISPELVEYVDSVLHLDPKDASIDLISDKPVIEVILNI